MGHAKGKLRNVRLWADWASRGCIAGISQGTEREQMVGTGESAPAVHISNTRNDSRAGRPLEIEATNAQRCARENPGADKAAIHQFREAVEIIQVEAFAWVRNGMRNSGMSKNIASAKGEPAQTTAPVETSPANDAEFCDCAGAFLRFGLKRSLLYDLFGQRLIKGVSLRRRGAVRGKRLWNVDSIRAYLNSQMKMETQ